MPIRPIDVMKTQEVSQYKQIQNQKPQHEQVQISKSFQNLIQAEASKTVQTSKSENNEFRYDAKEEGRNSYSGSSGKGKKDQEKQNKDNKSYNKTGKRPGGIDILI
ncbi:MAG: hypothetical protein EWM47_06475 [Anaerolineaceae bacterium]|nr:MAG: hypothetical protein EWM47_06475 [Anaerolineaceae bacterium]